MNRRGYKKWIAIGATAALGWAGTALAQDTMSDTPDSMDMEMENQLPDYQQPIDHQAIEPAPDSATEVEINQYQAPTEGTGGSGSEATYKPSRIDRNLPGFGSVKVGGGVEAPTAGLRDQLSAGPMWSASLAAQPLTWMGLEGMYSGGTFEVDNSITGPNNQGASNGADFVRNGGQIAATFNLPTPFIQPYALGGIGIDRVNFRAADTVQFRDDTAGRVPLGGGLRASVGAVVADLRANYNVLFDQDYARRLTTDKNGASYDVGLQVGAQF